MKVPHGLPHPSPSVAAHSERAVEQIVRSIDEAGGAIGFATFMHEALYAPGLGYYAAGATKFAEYGDFTTAPEQSPLFAAVLARQCAAVLSTFDSGVIVEFGAGSGALAADILDSLATLNALPRSYFIVEVSADLQERQKRRVRERVGHLPVDIQWVSDPATLACEGIVIGNEVLDALPVERFRIESDQTLQQFVTHKNGQLALDWQSASPVLTDAVDALRASLPHSLPEGYQSDYCLALESFLDVAAGVLTRGVVLLSDYGYGRPDYYAPDRSDGTLMCHYRHHAHANPLWLPGAQDITAWVDFSRVAEHLDRLGMRYLGYTTQSQFLLAGGLPAIVESADNAAALAAGAKTLLMPGEMGERFRFIGFARACDATLSGFDGRDYGTRL